MIILLTKDGATKVSREVKTADDLDVAFATGCHIELVLGEGQSQAVTREAAGELLEAELAAAPAQAEAEPEAAEVVAAPPSKKTAPAKTAKKR